MQPVNYVRTRRASSSRPRDNGKMNAKWRTQRHLSIRDLDWRSLFLSDSSFHAIDDHTGLRERSGSFLLFFSSSSSPFCLFLSKRLHNNRPYCDHGAPLNLNYYAQKKFSCLFPRLLRLLRLLSHERVYSCLLRRMILKRISFAGGTVSLGFPVFPAFMFFFSLLSWPPTQLRNHRSDRNATKYFQNFYTYESPMIYMNVDITCLSPNIYLMM